ncbi:hypothetical protein M422DRAFT_784055 [Sphaerobolus stellatus SS14]|uniref:Unplaced genomic scaffold SPHSTscaffold_190, whole genome shotgun sequence n=1 Tax=Sphaerobolus stellatus (strain SS14) TaxID=990650 RepID=A0A0C9UYQ4_SPHS4|nr:hypothetical protein M422DRAFT_784055 [Sphaerobolus stellatus SS14]
MSGPDTPQTHPQNPKEIRASLPSVLAPEIALHLNFVRQLDGDRDRERYGSGSFGTAGGGRGGGEGTFGAGGSGVYPSRDDFERNFDNLPDAESFNDDGGAYLSDEYENSDDNLDYTADQGENGGEGEEGPLASGIYLALFDFEPEGTAEMALVEGQEVRVRAGRRRRGGEGAEEYALVPESYLKFVRGGEDGNDEDGDE